MVIPRFCFSLMLFGHCIGLISRWPKTISINVNIVSKHFPVRVCDVLFFISMRIIYQCVRISIHFTAHSHCYIEQSMIYTVRNQLSMLASLKGISRTYFSQKSPQHTLSPCYFEILTVIFIVLSLSEIVAPREERINIDVGLPNKIAHAVS
jgi:hypothetical protein